MNHEISKITALDAKTLKFGSIKKGKKDRSNLEQTSKEMSVKNPVIDNEEEFNGLGVAEVLDVMAEFDILKQPQNANEAPLVTPKGAVAKHTSCEPVVPRDFFPSYQLSTTKREQFLKFKKIDNVTWFHTGSSRKGCELYSHSFNCQTVQVPSIHQRRTRFHRQSSQPRLGPSGYIF
jgi:hypothetical protein